MSIALTVTGAFILLIFVMPVFYRVFNFGTIAGVVFGLFSLLSGVFWNKLSDRFQGISAIVVVFGIIFALKLMWDIYAAGKTKASSQKVIVILGCQVKGDEPSLSLIKRVDSAYRFLLKNPNSVAVLTGGKGRGENITEAECMRRILYDRGILNQRMILEEKSTTTDENIRFAKKLLQERGIETAEIAVATSEYHQKRASIICQRYGYTAFAQSSHTKPILLPTFLVREFFGIVKEKYNIRLK